MKEGGFNELAEAITRIDLQWDLSVIGSAGAFLAFLLSSEVLSMSKEDSEFQAVIALDLINEAFANRTPPLVLTDSMQLSDSEYAEVISFQ